MARDAARKTITAERPPLPDGTVLMALDPSSKAIGFAIFDGQELRLAGLVGAAPEGWDKVRRSRHNAHRVVV